MLNRRTVCLMSGAWCLRATSSRWRRCREPGLIERLPILPHHDLEVWVNEEGGILDSCHTNRPFLEGFNEVLGSVLMGPKFVAGDVLVIETEGLMDHHRDGRVHKILVAKSTPDEQEE